MGFQLIKREYFNQDYRGKAEACNYTFTVNLPDQLGASWTAERHLNATITELQSQGSRILEYRLWEDKLSGTFTTDYKCEIVASASPLWWNLIIIGIIALLSLAVTAWAIMGVRDIVEYGGPAAAIGLGALGIIALILVAVAVLGERRGAPG